MTIADIKTNLHTKYPNQTLFLQAADELLESVEPYLSSTKASEHDYARVARLLVPERIIAFKVTWEDDAHVLQYNTAYRVQFSSALGPYKGGLRFDPSVNEDVLKFLGFEQIFKNALTGLPLGAGKGGSDFDPRGKSDAEIRRFCIAMMVELSRHIGADTDVPAGDIGVGAREIGYLYGAYKRMANRSDGILTGKGVGYGGSLIRTEATGYGAVYFAKEMLAHASDTLEGKRAVVSGAGNVATHAAEKLIAEGVQVLTLSDRHGYVLAEGGMTQDQLETIMSARAVRKSLEGVAAEIGLVYKEGKVWEVAADLYFPCATQNELDETDAVAIIGHGGQLVCEGANMPSTPEAVVVFQKADVLFAPGKAANAGGVAVSGLEMSQNAGRIQWTEEVVDAELRKIMKQIHATCVRYGATDSNSDETKSAVDYVDGANIGGFIRVFAAMEELGW